MSSSDPTLDRAIERELRHRLEQAYLIDPADVEVAAADGVVTLRGSCDQWELARMLGQIASHIPGVSRVDSDELHIRFRGGGADRAPRPIGGDVDRAGAFQSLSPPLPPAPHRSK